MTPQPELRAARTPDQPLETDASAGWREEYSFAGVEPDLHDPLGKTLSKPLSQDRAQAQRNDIPKGKPLNSFSFWPGLCKRCSSRAAHVARATPSRRRSLATSDESMPHDDTAVALDEQPDHHAPAAPRGESGR